ncbi:DUF429 domain-containing protein [Gemmobacter serpentinus]|uniref:DUF429 domain-containing protein n=1 Tax=Gemmobacter serpentinus TaxID=2652247 RepID=UPI00124C27BD|nr:DUF429 domain-containing protein [Gemmobacter serpentinus]
MQVLGIDGCKGGWIGCVTDPDFKAVSVLSDTSLQRLIERGAAAWVVVDMPIGLSSTQSPRPCEVAVASWLNGKRASVFNTPVRAAVETADYTAAIRINLEASGKSIPPMSWAIVPKIRELDALVRSVKGTLIREGHPELSFALAHGHPILAPKKSALGACTRIGCLARHGLKIETFDLSELTPVAQTDDLLDATIMAWTAARLSRAQHLSFPEAAAFDAFGLPMQMVA